MFVKYLQMQVIIVHMITLATLIETWKNSVTSSPENVTQTSIYQNKDCVPPQTSQLNSSRWGSNVQSYNIHEVLSF